MARGRFRLLAGHQASTKQNGEETGYEEARKWRASGFSDHSQQSMG